MKKKLFFLLALLLLAGVSHASCDFSAVCGTGQTLYYKISGTTVSVTYPYYYDGYYDDYYYNCTKPSGNLVIPSTVTNNGTTYSVTSIGNHAFCDCSGLTSVTIPNSVTSIGERAFSGCSGLTSVTIGNSVTSIGGSAFSGCIGLTSVTIPNSVTSIGYGAFFVCSGLTSIDVENGNTVYDSRNGCNAIIETATNILIAGCKNTSIPNSVTSIGNAAFQYCSGLTSVTIPNSVTSIGDYAFWLCSGLTSVTIPNSVTSIGNYAFQNCSGLTSVTIGNSVDTIQAGAFSNCTGMQVLHLGSALHYVGEQAFYNCDHLDTIYSLNPTPATVANVDAFENVWKGLPLIVPTGSRNAYTIAYAWREFTNIQEGTLPQGIEDAVYDGVVMKSVDGRIVIDGADGHGVTLTDIQGRILYRGTATGTLTVDVPASGIYLLQLDNRPAKRISVVR